MAKVGGSWVSRTTSAGQPGQWSKNVCGIRGIRAYLLPTFSVGAGRSISTSSCVGLGYADELEPAAGGAISHQHESTRTTRFLRG
jgi:hypothetical protein